MINSSLLIQNQSFTWATAAINNLQWSILNFECRSNEWDNSVSLSKISKSFSSISFYWIENKIYLDSSDNLLS
jgi:hypothetical protein